MTIDRVHFEWVPPGGLLGELDGDRPMGDEPATGVDVALWGRLKNHRRAVVLIEVKLSEGNFTHCGGRKSRRNRRRDVCESAKLFLDEPNACYLRRPWGSSGTDAIGRYSPGATEASGTHSPTPTSTGHVHSLTTCSSRCGTSQSRGASNKRTWSSGHGSRSVLTTLIVTSPCIGRTGNAFLVTPRWLHRFALRRS